MEHFGKLTVVGEGGWYTRPSGKRLRLIRCRCDCGTVTEAPRSSLRRGLTTSCGCYRREILRKGGVGNRKHGEAARETPEYRAWRRMIQRCEDPKDQQWENYGARGIRVCAEWRNDYSTFLAYIGRRPNGKPGRRSEYSLDRYPNPDGNYEPGNVRWATQKQQAGNKRRIVHGDRSPRKSLSV